MLEFVVCCFGLVLELMVYLADGDETAIFLLSLFACSLALIADGAMIHPWESADFDQLPATLHDIVQDLLSVDAPILAGESPGGRALRKRTVIVAVCLLSGQTGCHLYASHAGGGLLIVSDGSIMFVDEVFQQPHVGVNASGRGLLLFDCFGVDYFVVQSD